MLLYGPTPCLLQMILCAAGRPEMLNLGLDKEIQQAAALAVVGESIAAHSHSHAGGKHGRDCGAVRQRRRAQFADLGAYLGLLGSVSAMIPWAYETSI